MLPPRPKARSVQQCQIYLNRLAAVLRKAGDAEARRMLPLIVRLKAELAAAKAEDALLQEFLGRPSLDTRESEIEHD